MHEVVRYASPYGEHTVNVRIPFRAQLLAAWEQVRTSFWFVPVLMSVGAAILALTSLAIDGAISDETIDGMGWVYTGSPEGARALLSTVASSAITVAGTTFSITIAALSLASSQFGPRLLRTFVRDTGNQVVLGTFVSTFLYCLLVLRDVRGLEDTRVVPHISVSVGIVLAIASLGVLIYFIHHVAMSIRADQVIAAVSGDLDHAIERLFPADLGQPASQPPDPAPQDSLLPADFAQAARPLPARRDGYMQVIDADALLDFANEQDLIVRLCQRPGDFIVIDEPLALIWPPERATEEVGDTLRALFIIGSERTAQQDATFAIDQLAEVAARALSPGINDPYTAITCIDHLGAALRRVAPRPFPAACRSAADGQLRIVADPLTFETLIHAAFDQIRLYSRDNVIVTVRLLDTLARIGRGSSDSARRAVLAQQVERTFLGSSDILPTDADRELLERHYRAARDAVGQR